MAAHIPRLALLVAAIVGMSFPSRAHAWAHAQVSTATADVALRPDGAIRVHLTLRVRVLGGWLTELEVAGLDPGLRDAADSPPTFTTATLEPVEFDAVAESGGRYVFRFPRGRSPRVGEYVADVTYDAVLEPTGADAELARFRWTFPGWAAGLDDVRLRFSLPGAAHLEGDRETGVQVEERTEGERRLVELHRMHLPRSTPWSATFALPRSLVPAAILPPAAAQVAAIGTVTSHDGRPQPAMRYLSVALVLIALVKRVGFDRRARARRAHARPLLPMPAPLAVLLLLALGVAADQTWTRHPELAFVALASVVLMAVQRVATRPTAARLGAFHAATRDERRSARFSAFLEAFAPDALVDATRPLGLLCVGGLTVVLARLHAFGPVDSVDAVFTVPHALVLLFVLGFFGGHGMLPMSVDRKLVRLEAVAKALRIPAGHGEGFAFNFAVHRDAKGNAQDARLRFFMTHRAKGLVRLDVTIVERPTLGGYVARPVVLCVVRQGSDAERILAMSLDEAQVRTAPGGRRARILPLGPATFAIVDRLAVEAPTVAVHGPRPTSLSLVQAPQGAAL